MLEELKQDLKRQLSLEQEQHQRELSALQHVHDENVQSMIRRHQAELEQPQPQQQQQQQQPKHQQQKSPSDLVDELAAKNEQLESMLNESTQLFEEETQSLKKSLEEKEKTYIEQQVQLKEDSQSLAASLAACQDRVISKCYRVLAPNYWFAIEQIIRVGLISFRLNWILHRAW